MDSPAAFSPLDWALLAVVAAMWGSSFLLIEIGIGGFEPTAVTWLRILTGAVVLGAVPAARAPILRRDWALVGLLGLVWMDIPFLLFAIAQQSVASSLAGMINGAAPLFTAAIAATWSRRLPSRGQLTGLLLGFGGVLAINWPAAEGATATMLGAAMIVAATFLYGIAFNLAEPLQRRSGALPVIWRAQLVAAAVMAPPGLVGVAGSSPTLSSMTAVAALGALSTGLAFAAFTTLVGRVGAARASVTVYFIPVVAIGLGVALRGETVAGVAVAGTALVLVGAFLTSRR